MANDNNVMRRAKATVSPVVRIAGESSAKAPRVKPVRITIDLDPRQHKELKQFAIDNDLRSSQIVRALLDELVGDPILANTVISNAVTQ